MGLFRNDDDRACAGVMKLLLENAPKELRAQVQRELDWDTSIVVEDAITPSAKSRPSADAPRGHRRRSARPPVRAEGARPRQGPPRAKMGIVSDVWTSLGEKLRKLRRAAERDARDSVLPDERTAVSANVSALYELRQAVDDAIDDEVNRGRPIGVQWDLLGSTRQQAQQRHKRATARNITRDHA
jgi:hypothetical protein